MIQTVVKPNETNFDMKVSLPKDYVGKDVHVLFYLDEEVKTTKASISNKKKPSDYFGTLSKETGKKLQAHIVKSRSDWERDF
jgi:putative transposon-encoded protein